MRLLNISLISTFVVVGYIIIRRENRTLVLPTMLFFFGTALLATTAFSAWFRGSLHELRSGLFLNISLMDYIWLLPSYALILLSGVCFAAQILSWDHGQ